ncbi:MAG: DUF1566 domain-containing protein [Candidatus Moraniibacteriota bacterium]
MFRRQWFPTKYFVRLKPARLIVGMSLVVGVIGGGFLWANAQGILDSFTDSSRVAATWNTAVDTGAGQVTLATQSCDDGVWHCGAANICGNTLGDGTYILVKRADVGAVQQWKNANTACDKPHCGTDGGQDGDQLVADNTVNYTNYPARDACKAVGGRLPTLTELSCMYTNRTSFGNNFVASNYWSATEYDTAYAWSVNMSNGIANFITKTYTTYVRCVRGW